MPIGNFALIEIMGTHKEDSIPRLRLGIVLRTFSFGPNYVQNSQKDSNFSPRNTNLLIH
jgi:hypothetical protein